MKKLALTTAAAVGEAPATTIDPPLVPAVFDVPALVGATTTTLDLSKTYLDWARRNFRHHTGGRIEENKIVRVPNSDSFREKGCIQDINVPAKRFRFNANRCNILPQQFTGTAVLFHEHDTFGTAG